MFRMKIKHMMAEVIDNDIFGTCLAHVRVVAFQKKGLPRAHFIPFLQKADKEKMLDSKHVDNMTNAEISPKIITYYANLSSPT